MPVQENEEKKLLKYGPTFNLNFLYLFFLNLSINEADIFITKIKIFISNITYILSDFFLDLDS